MTQHTHETLVELRAKLQSKINDLHRQMQETTDQMQAVATTLQLLGHSEALSSPPVELPRLSVDPESLKGLGQLEALKKIARINNNRLRTVEARTLLLRAGLIKNPKNASNIIFSVINRSEQFRRLEAGVYEIVADADAKKRQELDDLNKKNAQEMVATVKNVAEFLTRPAK